MTACPTIQKSLMTCSTKVWGQLMGCFPFWNRIRGRWRTIFPWVLLTPAKRCWKTCDAQEISLISKVFSTNSWSDIDTFNDCYSKRRFVTISGCFAVGGMRSLTVIFFLKKSGLCAFFRWFFYMHLYNYAVPACLHIERWLQTRFTVM